MGSMGGCLRRCAAALLFLLGCSGVLAADSPAPRPPAEQFFRDPAFSSAALSPDGKLLAFRTRSKGGRARLAVLDLQTMKPNVVASFNDADVGRLEWVNDKRLVFNLATELEAPGAVKMGPGLFAVNHDGSGFRELVETLNPLVRMAHGDNRVLRWNTFLQGAIGKRDTDDVLVITPEEYGLKTWDYFKLRRLNTMNGRVTDVDAPLHSIHWILDRAGELRSTVSLEGNTATIHYRGANGAWRKLDAFDRYFGEGMSPRFVDADGKLYVQSSVAGDKVGLHIYDPETRKLSDKPVLASADYDVDASFVFDDRKLLGIRHVIDAEVVEWLDVDMKAVQAAVDALLPRTTNRIEVASRPETSFVLVEAFADTQPNVFYLFDTRTKKLSKLGSTLPEIDPRQMGEMDMHRFKARDGLPIPAYLTLPPGTAKKNLPMVVLVHGGPWVRGSSWHWDPQVQFLASRGYAVLQPEFRGGTGFGSRHFEAGWKQWGLAMQNDIADAARWAIAQGTADPKRICIAGASYGGYSALMGLVNDPDLFRCGISWAGVTDIELMYSVGWSDSSDDYKRHGMPTLIGDRVKDAAQLKATSPLVNAARIKQPLLMAHGGYDVRVPIVHGEKFRDAVKAHNPQVEWVVYPDEGHGLVQGRDMHRLLDAGRKIPRAQPVGRALNLAAPIGADRLETPPDFGHHVGRQRPFLDDRDVVSQMGYRRRASDRAAHGRLPSAEAQRELVPGQAGSVDGEALHALPVDLAIVADRTLRKAPRRVAEGSFGDDADALLRGTRQSFIEGSPGRTD
jgi:dipeptidyl aminopeptidase/acylaminoacyl peptidase